MTIFAITNGYTGGFTAFNFDGFIGNLTLTGIGTDETITGATGNDVLSGGDGNDMLNGLAGTDTLNGGIGNDNLNGGTGFDTATYAGNASDYTVVYQFDGDGKIIGFLSVTDNNAGDGDEGADTLDQRRGGQLQRCRAEYDAAGAIVQRCDPDRHVQHHPGRDRRGRGRQLDPCGRRHLHREIPNVNKDVTIYGANDGIAGNGTRGAETIINGQIVINADGVTIDGVSAVGAGSGVIGTTAIVVSSGSDGFSIVNSVLDGTGDVAIFVGAVTGLDVGHNLLTGYSIGMYISTGGTSGSVHDNLFQGDDAGFGVGMGNGVNSETSHVTITGNTFDGIYAGSLNLYPFGPDPVDINTYVYDNFFTDSGVERPIQIDPTSASTHIIGTDESEAFYDANQGLPGELAASLEFHGRGGDDHAYGNSLADALYGDDGSDRLFGFGGDDLLVGGAGNDLLDGEAGIDTAEFADSALGYSDTVIGWLVSSSEGNDFLQRTEIAVDGTGERNLLVGGTAFATLQAALNAAEDNDNVRLAAGTYAGTFNYADFGLTVIAQGGAVINATFAPAASQGITVLAAGAVDHITTGAGNDVLVGGAGADVMTGAAGDDIYVVDNANDAVNESNGGGNDIVYAMASYALNAGGSVERLSSIDWTSTNALNLTGNELSNLIEGNAGANVLNGGGGADTMVGFGGDDIYVVDDAGDVVTEGVGQGNDIVYALASHALAAGSEVERLSTIDWSQTDAINLTGNEIANLIEGNAGANVLNGGGGADTLVGFGGDDIYVVDNSGDLVIETNGNGNDVVYALSNYTLNAGASVETLSSIDWSSTSALNLTGNEIANVVNGNAGANTLNGGAGSDVLTGFGGADNFAFTTALGAGNVDLISDFVAADDTIQLDDGVFAGLSLGALNANAFVVGTAAGDADDRIIYNQTTGQLFFDEDGNGAGAAVWFATLQGAPVITASDFTVI